MAQENQPHLVEEEEEYDADFFSSAACYQKWLKFKDIGVIKERGINLKKVEEQLPEFFQRLQNNGWSCFAREPNKANTYVVREFYSNAAAVNFNDGELVATVRGKQVRFDAATINAVYGLEDVDNALYKARATEGGTQWLIDMLQGGKTSSWSTYGLKVTSTDFTAEARIWLSIICTRVMPSSNESTLEKARLIAALIDGFKVNVGEIIVGEIEEVVKERTRSLFFPSLIHRLCKNAGVEKRAGDKFITPEPPVYPLLKKGPGGAIQAKKRKTSEPSQIDVDDPTFGQFLAPTTTDAPGSSYTPMPPLASGASNMKYISSQIFMVDAHIRELVAGLPSGPDGEGSSSRPSGTVSLETVVAEQEQIRSRLDRIEKRHKKFEKRHKKFGKRTSSFLNKMMKKLQSLCSSVDEEEEDDVLGYPTTHSHE